MSEELNFDGQLAKESEQQKALTKANVTEQILADIESRYANLKISGPDDKEGFHQVREARLHCKSLRVNATKICKAGREEAVAEQKRWLAAEKACVSRIEAVEAPLKAEEDRINAEIEAIKKEKAEAEARMIMDRTHAANAVGWQITFEECKNMSDDLFSGELAKRQEEYESEMEARRIEAERIEAERIEAERKEAEERARIEAEQAAESKRIEAEREALRKKEEELRAIQEENKRKEAAMKAESERIAAERRHAEELEAARQKAAADAIAEERRKAEEADRRRIEEERIEAERIKAEQAAAELKAAQAPDKEKLFKFIAQLQGISVPAMSTAAGKAIAASIVDMARKMATYIEEKANTL